MSLLIDQLVLLDGLKNEALNGATGTVIRNQEFDSTGRYSIQLKRPPSAVVSFPLPVKIQGKNLLVIHECARPGCVKVGRRKCSACNNSNASYCSPECQKLDWKVHKIICPSMKNGDQLVLSVKEATSTICKLLEEAKLKEGTQSEIRILEYSLSFGEYQLHRNENETCLVGGNRNENWVIEIDNLCNLCMNLAESYKIMAAKMAMNDRCVDVSKKAIYYFEKSLPILERWRVQLASKTTDGWAKMKLNIIYTYLSRVERLLGGVHLSLCHYDIAGSRFEKALSYGKLVVIGDERTELVHEALIDIGINLELQLKFKEVLVLYEEAYNLAAIAYSLDHHLVLRAAYFVIEILLKTEEYETAERYARICYECRTKPIDNDGTNLYMFSMYSY
jgi:tetratricopeptide (TPR) repeat protein